MSSPNVRDENGESYIPPSQRPDGTWRKARRVKEGYVPQEEVPLYESKGKQSINHATKLEVVLPSGIKAHQPIPGLFIIDDKEKAKAKKKSKADALEIEKRMEQIKLRDSSIKLQKTDTKSELTNQGTDPAKRLKNLKKRLREVELLEVKLKEGAIPKPEPEQLAKLQRKSDLLLQISEFEKIVCSQV